MTTADTRLVLGRDRNGPVVQDADGDTWYITDCCGASAKGGEMSIVCRSCYQDVDPALGDVPDADFVRHPDTGSWDFVKRPLQLTEVFGDGITVDAYLKMAAAEHVADFRRRTGL